MSELLRQAGRAPASSSKTVTAYRFEVPAGTEALVLTFDFGPRESRDRAANLPLIEAAFDRHVARRRPALGPEGVAQHRDALKVDERADSLQNLMNVVLVDPAGRWRGRWDRLPAAASGELLLAERCASRGFVAGRIQPGSWTAAVEHHGIFGGVVDYTIAVRARAAPDDAEVAALAETGYREAAYARRGPGWYFGELHSHSSHSDGRHEMAEIADRASRCGLDFLALTDHNTMSAHPVPPGAPIIIVPGFELTTFHGHHPVYGVDEMVPWHEGGRVVPLGEIAPRVRAAGGIVGVAHPFVPGDPLCTGCRMVDDLAPESFDLVEVWYRRWGSPGSDNQAGYDLWNRLWAAGHHKTAVAARDWHGPEQEGPFPGALPLTGVFAHDATPAAIVDGLRSGRVILSRGPIADLTAGEANLSVGIERLDRPAELRLYRSGTVLMRRRIDGDVAIDLKPPGPGYYRAELWDGDEPLTLTNHVVIAGQ
jgi:hypothetical protein